MKTTYEEGQDDSETFWIRHTTTFTKAEWLNREVMVRGLFENNQPRMIDRQKILLESSEAIDGS